MNPSRNQSLPAPESDSQTLRALVQIRELLVRGEFNPGERISEIPLAARLGVSRTPLRLALERLAHEGLLQVRPKGGFVAQEFTPQDILDVIEMRGVLEGTAARLAAERLESLSELDEMMRCLDEIDEVLARRATSMETIAAYSPLNQRFHAHIVELAKSPILRRSLDQVLGLPFASPNAFVASQTKLDGWREVGKISQSQHRSIAEAIANREGTRAEAVTREHSRMGRLSVVRAVHEMRLRQFPGGSLVRIPEMA
jgi:GntR family transcriptional regulator of vanillate catabolism